MPHVIIQASTFVNSEILELRPLELYYYSNLPPRTMQITPWTQRNSSLYRTHHLVWITPWDRQTMLSIGGVPCMHGIAQRSVDLVSHSALVHAHIPVDKTVLQLFYDAHYANEAETAVCSFEHVCARLAQPGEPIFQSTFFCILDAWKRPRLSTTSMALQSRPRTPACSPAVIEQNQTSSRQSMDDQIDAIESITTVLFQ